MNQKNVLIIHHNKDLDGLFSGAIAKIAVERRAIGIDFIPELYVYGWDYSEPYLPPISEGELCIVTDLSIGKDRVMELSEQFIKVLVIDHHLSTNFLAEIGKPENVELFWRNDFSAAELAWSRLIEENEDITLVNPTTTPFAVRYIGSYDIYRDKGRDFWDTEIMPFQMGMRMIATSVNTVPDSLLTWSFSRPESLNDIIAMGNVVINYEKFLTSNLIDRNSRIGTLTIKGLSYNEREIGVTSKYSALWINTMHPPANLTDVVSEKGIDVDLIICFNLAPSGLWVYSLRTTKEYIGCNLIAGYFFGGGHRKAAGFQIIELLCEAQNTEIWDAKVDEVIEGSLGIIDLSEAESPQKEEGIKPEVEVISEEKSGVFDGMAALEEGSITSAGNKRNPINTVPDKKEPKKRTTKNTDKSL